MPVLNFFPCKLGGELVIWRNEDISSTEYHQLREKHCFIRFPDNRRKMAYPMRGGYEILLSELGFRPIPVKTSDYLSAFSDLCKYGFVSFLMDLGFQALHENPAKVEASSIAKLYNTDSPIYEFPPSDPELVIYEGVGVRKQYWNPPTSGPIGGISIRYTTTPYFVKPLDEILEGVEDFSPYVQMKCPVDCGKKDCPFYSEKRLIGKFIGFADGGFPCKMLEGDYKKFVRLSDRRQGIEENPPANRVSIERNLATISQWAEKRHGKKDILTEIREARGEEIAGRKNPKKVVHDYKSTLKLIELLPEQFQLPNGQPVTWDKNMLRIEVL